MVAKKSKEEGGRGGRAPNRTERLGLVKHLTEGAICVEN
jgi:hypothetical protein